MSSGGELFESPTSTLSVHKRPGPADLPEAGLIFVSAGPEGICRLLQAPKIHTGGPKLMPGLCRPAHDYARRMQACL
jgi:hypothetical protein